MDVKKATGIVSGQLPYKYSDDWPRAEGFLDAIDQLKATGVKEAIEGQLDSSGNCHGNCCNNARVALAKLNALLGEKP